MAKEMYYGDVESSPSIDQGLRAHMLNVYNLMFSGLVVSAFFAWIVNAVPAVNAIFFNLETGAPTGLFTIVMFAPLAIIIGMSWFMSADSSASKMRFWYWAFVSLQGVALSFVAVQHAGMDIMLALVAAAAVFGGMSLYGYTTKRDLSGLGAYLFAALIALLVVMIASIFIASTGLQIVISLAGILLFTVLIAFDTQMIKGQYNPHATAEERSKVTTWGAISLYLDFLNMFLFILNILGIWKTD